MFEVKTKQKHFKEAFQNIKNNKWAKSYDPGDKYYHKRINKY